MRMQLRFGCAGALCANARTTQVDAQIPFSVWGGGEERAALIPQNTCRYYQILSTCCTRSLCRYSVERYVVSAEIELCLSGSFGVCDMYEYTVRISDVVWQGRGLVLGCVAKYGEKVTTAKLLLHFESINQSTAVRYVYIIVSNSMYKLYPKLYTRGSRRCYPCVCSLLDSLLRARVGFCNHSIVEIS